MQPNITQRENILRAQARLSDGPLEEQAQVEIILIIAVSDSEEEEEEQEDNNNKGQEESAEIAKVNTTRVTR